MLLTIDAGNTRTKWAVFNSTGAMSHAGACLNDALTNVDISPATLGYQRVIISNVAGEAHANLIMQKFAAYTLPVCWIKATSQACSVINLYATPSNLGSDRWAALISAWHINQAPCIVINGGTAVTIDALNAHQFHEGSLSEHTIDSAALNIAQAEFIGGLILPGLHLMEQSLGLAAAQLPSPTLSTNTAIQVSSDIFAKNTSDAIYSGAVLAIVGAITLMAHELNKRCTHKPNIIISGGNAKTIYDTLVLSVTNPVLIVDNLVLQGLFLLESATPINFVQSESQ